MIIKLDMDSVIEEAKAAKPIRKNYSFRFNEELLRKFSRKCEKLGLQETAAIEALLKAFNDSK